jgi:hypothetical protein
MMIEVSSWQEMLSWEELVLFERNSHDESFFEKKKFWRSWCGRLIKTTREESKSIRTRKSIRMSKLFFLTLCLWRSNRNCAELKRSRKKLDVKDCWVLRGSGRSWKAIEKRINRLGEVRSSALAGIVECHPLLAVGSMFFYEAAPHEGLEIRECMTDTSRENSTSSYLLVEDVTIVSWRLPKRAQSSSS